MVEDYRFAYEELVRRIKEFERSLSLCRDLIQTEGLLREYTSYFGDVISSNGGDFYKACEDVSISGYVIFY